MSFGVISTLPAGIKRYREKLGLNEGEGVDFKAKSQCALMLLKWCNTGSAADSVVPPILTGNLRGSASVFVGAALVQTTRGDYPVGNPVESYADRPNVITIIYNAAYAAWLHENPMGSAWMPGPVSEQSGDVGDKWVERHLKADGPALLKMYAEVVKEEMGKA